METQVSSEVLYNGRILNLRRDKVRVEHNGRLATREVVEHKNAVAMLALDSENRFLLVRQFRYAVGCEVLEIPAGLIEDGEAPLDAAQRELREETGYSAGSWTEFPPVFSSPGFSDEQLYIYFASDLHKDPLPADEDENIALVRITEEEAREMLSNPSVTQDAKTLMALSCYLAGK